MANYRVWYMRPEHFRDGMCGLNRPTVATLSDTHIFLRDVEATDLEHCYYNSQGEIWSPMGEARELIRSKGLQHTSMSRGDVIELDGRFWLVASFGFEDLA
jgi:hypothetical protein